jgi:hypothetical protein
MAPDVRKIYDLARQQTYITGPRSIAAGCCPKGNLALSEGT